SSKDKQRITMSCVGVPHVGSVDRESEKAGVQQDPKKLSRGLSINSQEACGLRRGEAESRHLEKLAADAFNHSSFMQDAWPAPSGSVGITLADSSTWQVDHYYSQAWRGTSRSHTRANWGRR